MERIPLPAVPAASPLPDETAARWRMLSWPIGLGTLLLAFSAAVSALSLHSLSHAESTGGGATEQAAAVAFVDVEEGVGQLYPVQHGRVTKVPVKEGERVKKGALLLQVDDRLARRQQKEAEVAVQAARERVVQAKQALAQHEKQVLAQEAAVKAMRCKLDATQAGADKVARLRKQGLRGSDEDVEIARKMVLGDKAGVDAEEAKLELVKASKPAAQAALADLDVKAKEEQLEKAKLAVGECQVLAPSDGVLLRRMVSVGDVLGPNPQAPILLFVPVGDLIVRAEVEQEFASRMHEGQEVDVKDDPTSAPICKGRIKRVSHWYAQRRSILMEPRQFNDVRTLEVIIELPASERDTLKNAGLKTEAAKNAGLKIGQRMRVEVKKSSGSSK